MSTTTFVLQSKCHYISRHKQARIYIEMINHLANLSLAATLSSSNVIDRIYYMFLAVVRLYNGTFIKKRRITKRRISEGEPYLRAITRRH